MRNEEYNQLAQQFDLAENELVSEEKILEALALRVAALMDKNPDQLFSMLYRLDIDENKIKMALRESDVSKKIALLIYERQLQKIISRKENKSDEPNETLAW